MLESGYSIGFLFAVGLHLLLPMEAPNMRHQDMKTGDLKTGLYDPTAPRHGSLLLPVNPGPPLVSSACIASTSECQHPLDPQLP